ncbi:MAG: nucleotidyltransferase domain-containing protein, partial [Methanolobus sp.]|nr:nucleotidyltransferase domain-containing protein [Methanolobus sp.]
DQKDELQLEFIRCLKKKRVNLNPLKVSALSMVKLSMGKKEIEHIGIGNIRSLIKKQGDEIRQLFKADIVGIFGSYSRSKENDGSDVDVLVNFDDETTLSDLVGPGDYLEGMLGLPVYVVSMRALHPQMKSSVLKEMVTI